MTPSRLRYIHSVLFAALAFALGAAVDVAPATPYHADIYDPGDWPLYSRDFDNSNYNPVEQELRPSNAAFLRRAWETFDDDPATGMRIKVYALNAANGKSRWLFRGGRDYVELRAGAALRHVSVANGLLFVTSSAGRLFVLETRTGELRFTDQTPDLNEIFGLGLSKPHHASMNSGALISNGMVYVPYGAQNHPSGGVIAYEANHKPRATDDTVSVPDAAPVLIDALDNDSDPNGDRLRFSRVGGQWINPHDGHADTVRLPYGTVQVFNPGDDSGDPEAAYLKFTPFEHFNGSRRLRYQVEDIAPNRVVNGVELDQLEPTHRPRSARARVRLIRGSSPPGLRPVDR